jgi:formylmethanofuran dehydrogenase subunit E
MYVCKSCGNLFSEVKRWKEDRGECFGFPAYEEFVGSPCCQSGYAKARQCDSCGDYLIGSYIKLRDGSRYCEDCYQPMEIGDED